MSRSRARSRTTRRSCSPTSRPGNLDSANGRHIIDLLFEVNRTRKTTLVLVTHDADLAALAEVRLALRDGEHRPRALAARARVRTRVSFVLRMALRETRAAWKRLLFFFICLAIGVGAIVALRSVIGSVRGAMTRGGPHAHRRRHRRLHRSSRGPRADRAELDRQLAAIRRCAAAASRWTRRPWSRPADERKAVARMVELRGVDAAFPLYGEVRLQNGGTYSHALLEQNGVLVRPELLTQLASPSATPS